MSIALVHYFHTQVGTVQYVSPRTNHTTLRVNDGLVEIETVQVGVNLDTYIDFEDGFDQAILEIVLDKPLVHLSGGNTYRFLKALKSHRLEERAIEFSQSGGAFVGVSAGAILLTPNINSAALCGDLNHVGIDDLSSIGLVNFMFVPHTGKKQEELYSASQLATQHNYDIYMCNDEEGIVLLDGQIHLIGSPVLVESVKT